MKRISRFKAPACFLFAAALVFASCSLERKTTGMRIKLSPRGGRIASLKRAPWNGGGKSLARQLSQVIGLSSIEIPESNIESLDDLACFGINMTGGGIPAGNRCNSHVQKGQTDGTVGDINGVFEPTISANGTVTFEAYGTNSCEEMDGLLGGSVGEAPLWYLGSAQADPLEDGEVEIPVSFEPDKVFTCTNDYSPRFFDDFNYNDGSLATESGAAWIDTALSPLELNTAAITANIASGTYAGFANETIDTERNKIRISATIEGSPGGNVAIFTVGLANTNTSTPTASIGCTLNQTNTPPLTTLAIAGKSAIDLVPVTATGSSGSSTSITPPYRFVCEIIRQNGIVSMTAKVYDLVNDSLLLTGDDSFTDPCPGTCNNAYIEMINAPAGSEAVTLDDYLLELGDPD